MFKKRVSAFIISSLILISNILSAHAPLAAPNHLVIQKRTAAQLLTLWESINTQSVNRADSYSIDVWEKLLANAYQNAIQNKDSNLQYKLSLPLSFTYHAEAKFSKGTPLLQNLLKHKEKLSPSQYQQVLIKLEEEYRGSNDIEHAIEIRKERINNHFINNYWEIYRDCGLFEAAKKDLFQFVTPPPINNIKRQLYYFLLGDLYMQMKEVDSAKLIYSKALAESKNSILANKHTHQYDEGLLTYWEACFMGLIIKSNVEKGDFTNAIPTLLYDIHHSNDNTDNKISKIITLSKCYQHFKQYREAKNYLDSASILLTEKTVKPIQLEYLLTLSNYFSQVGKNDSSLFYYQAYNTYRDKLYQNIQKNQSILLLGQMEIANRRNELLQSKQSLFDSIKTNNNQKSMLLILIFSLILSIMLGVFLYINSMLKSRSKAKIEAQFKHNEILLKELHHRVKNNLQVMYSLLNLQKRRNEDVYTIDTLSSIQNRIQTMALVHQNLYSSGDFEMVGIAAYVKTLANHLESIYKIDKQKIDVTIDINEKLKMPIEMVISIGLIVNEAVSNAFKYAFKKKLTGTLLIKIIDSEIENSILIQDNGQGMQALPDMDNSLGMKLIGLMCAQLNATHSIVLENGVTHYIKFKKNI